MKRFGRLLAAAGLAAGATMGSASAQEVKLGVVLSNTGTFAFVGAPVINAVKLAHEEMVASGFFGATKVTLMVEDNRSDKQEALTLINRMATRDNAGGAGISSMGRVACKRHRRQVGMDRRVDPTGHRTFAAPC